MIVAKPYPARGPEVTPEGPNLPSHGKGRLHFRIKSLEIQRSEGVLVTT